MAILVQIQYSQEEVLTVSEALENDKRKGTIR